MSESLKEGPPDADMLIGVMEDEVQLVRSKPDFKVGDFADKIADRQPALSKFIKDAMAVTADDDAARRLEEAAYIVFEVTESLYNPSSSEEE